MKAFFLRALIALAVLYVSEFFLPASPPAFAQSSNPYARFGGTADANGNAVLPSSQLVGATAAQVGVSPGGVASYTIPITVPAGTTGVQPNVTLQFSSPGAEGALGYGGSIGGISYITRCPKDLFVDGVIDGVSYNANDQFCMNGQRLIPISGGNGGDGTEYRTRLESFSKIVSYGVAGSGPATFKVWRNSGEILEYGTTADSRIEALGSASVRVWAISRLSDRQGNYVSYDYSEDTGTGEFEIRNINYTGNVAQGVSPSSRISFSYDSRPQSSRFYHAGRTYYNEHRVGRVQVYSGSTLFRDYRLTYGVNAQVTSVQECASSNTADCFAPTIINWVNTETSTPPTNYMSPPLTLSTSGIGGTSNSTTSHLNWSPVAVGDVNGDGITDQVMMKRNKTTAIADEVWLGTRTGQFTHVNIGTSFLGAGSIYSTGDFNGDGRLDLLVPTTGTLEFWFGQINGTFVKNATGLGEVGDGPQTWTSGDFNGDGITDLYVAYLLECVDPRDDGNFVFCGKVEKAFLSNGVGGFATVNTSSNNLVSYSSGTGGPFGLPASSKTWSVANIGDFNGDGKADMFLMDNGGSTLNPTRPVSSNLVGVYKVSATSDRVLLSNGDGTFRNTTLATSNSVPVQHTLGVSADFNGDGLNDFHIFPSDTAGRVNTNPNDFLWLSKGDGTFEKFTLAGSVMEPSYAGYVVAASGDFDNDGYSDIYAYKVNSDGRKTSGIADVIWRGRPNLTFQTATVALANSIVGNHIVAGVGDYDGDGETDLYSYQASTSVAGTSDGTTSDVLYRGERIRYNLISRITNGIGLITEFDYKQMTDPTVYTPGGAVAYPVANVTSQSEVVSQVRSSNAIGGFNSQTYRYEGLREHTRGGGALGFSKVSIADDATGITSVSTYSQNYTDSNQGALLASQTIAPSGVILDDQSSTWTTMTFGAAGPTQRFFSYISQNSSIKKDLNGSALGTVTEQRTHDSFGNATQVKTITQDGAITHTKTTNSTYTNDTTNWILGRLSQATATHSSSGKADVIRTSSFTYGSTGQLASETVQPGDALSYTKTYSYNAFGAITGIAETWGSTATSGITATSRTTSYTYDALSRFRISETNPLGHSSSTAYHPQLGLPTSSTGPNGLTTTQTYDAFGNPILETRADGTTTQVWRFKCGGTVSCPANGSYVVVSKSTGQPLAAAYKDMLNRTLQETSVSLDGRLVDVKLTYNARGDVISKSEPAFDAGAPLWTNIQYDVLGRPTLTTAPDASTESVVYNGLVTSSTNGLGQTKTLTKNALGQLISSKDTTNNAVSFEYDALGQQTAIIDPLGLRTEMQYDVRGNKIAVTDPARGASTTRYNALGLVVETTDAKGQVARVTYDVMGRMLTRIDDVNASAQSTRTSTWTWDTATKGVGKAASTSGYGYTATPTYDSFGRPASVTEAMDGYSFTVSTSYDSLGRPATTAFPSGLTVRNIYAQYGHLQKLENAITNQVYWQLNATDARGNATQTALGNGINEYRTFVPETGLLNRIQSFGPIVGSGAIQDLTYVFDKIGNLTRRSDANQSLDETFAYDTLNRVIDVTTKAGPATVSNITVSYDVRGNITARSDVGAYTYGSTDGCGTAGPYAVKAVAGTKVASYCYDLNGDMTSGDGRTITWSAFGMPTEITKGLRSIALTYGPDRGRFKRVDTNETGITSTYYVAGGSYEVAVTQSGQTTSTAYIGGVATIATTTNGANSATVERYLLKDHLGSLDVMTDASGAVVQRYSFDTWGKRRDINWTAFISTAPFVWQSQPVTRGYTFHEQLDSVDLIHMNGRVYDAEIGRFLSADPFIQDVTNTQALNAYSYVLNNPLSFTDPSGYFFSSLFRAIGNAFKAIGRAFARAVRSIVRSSIGRAILQLVACAAGPAACVAASVGLTLAAGGTLKQAFIAGALAFAQVGLPQGGGGLWTAVGDAVAGSGTGLAGTIATHAIVGGALSVAQGGSFTSGLASGAFSAAAGGIAGGFGINNSALRVAIGAVVGGTASVLSGGKFANGAITAAFATIYNDLAAHGSEGTQSGIDYVGRAGAEGIGDPMYDAAAGAYSVLSPTAGATECWQAECGIGGWAWAAAGAIPGPGKGIWTVGRAGSSVENAFGHWLKHAANFPEFQNAKQYVEGARDFLTSPPSGTLTKVRSNGDVLRYNPGTNTFGSMNSSGVPKTMFRPQDGVGYWNRQ